MPTSGREGPPASGGARPFPRIRRGALLAALLTVALGLLALGATGSDGGPDDRVLCDECHDDFVPFRYTIDTPTEVPTDEPFDLTVTVSNDEMHAVYYPTAMLTVSDPGGMVIETGEPAVVNIREQGSVGFRESATFMVPIRPGALSATFVLGGTGGFLDDLDLGVSGPDGGSWSSTGAGLDETIGLDEGDIGTGGYGDYQVTVDHPRGVRFASFDLACEIEYGSGSMMLQGPESLQQGDSFEFVFTLRGVAEGPTDVTVTVTGTAVHMHSSGQDDEKAYSFEEEVPIEVGDEFVYGPRTDDGAGGPVGGLLHAGQALAFLSAGLLLVSVATSGNLHRLKLPRRAKVHCWSSYLLVGALLLHWTLLYVGPYGPPAALGTGLVLLLCIVGLAVTGARPALLDRKVMGITNRRMHAYLTYATVAVLAVHVVLNGSHLAFLR